MRVGKVGLARLYSSRIFVEMPEDAATLPQHLKQHAVKLDLAELYTDYTETDAITRFMAWNRIYFEA